MFDQHSINSIELNLQFSFSVEGTSIAPKPASYETGKKIIFENIFSEDFSTMYFEFYFNFP